MKKILLVVGSGFLAGCGPAPYIAISSHTIASGPDQSTDVLWLERDGREVYRCSGSPQGPVCVQAKLP